MGWSYRVDPQTKASLIQDRVKDKQFIGASKGIGRCLEYKCVGGVLWTVWSISDESTGMVKDTFIGCDLLQRFGRGWGYKDMAESMHPFAYSCPLHFLKMVPVACQEWRNEVIQWHQEQEERKERLAALQVGQRIELPKCRPPHVDIVSLKPLRGEYNGTVYRISAKHIGNVIQAATTTA